MTKKWLFMAFFLLEILSINTQARAGNPAGCDDKGRCFWLDLTNHMKANATIEVIGKGCYEGQGGSYTLAPLNQQRIGIARRQGHGCNGSQGNFDLKVNNETTMEFNFSNDTRLNFTTLNSKYQATLSDRSVTNDGWAQYEFDLNGVWQNQPICDSSRCFQLFFENALTTPITWNLTPLNCYQGTVPNQNFTVQPGDKYQISIARVQGHGCDGKQGEFELKSTIASDIESQRFNFSNEGIIARTDFPKGYLTFIGPKSRDNSFTYRVEKNITHTPSAPASTLGNWANSTTTLANFTTDGFWPNFYQPTLFMTISPQIANAPA